MMKSDREIIEYEKQVVPGFAEFLAIPEDQREAYVLGHVNEALINAGMDPIDRLLTDEELESARRKLHAPAKKLTFRRRFQRAWVILWNK
ncbi:hypothetical protein [Lacticaseibacillus porcinae]|uniref:hypothetical protein n=1 Tax=Lacticaseibacillus porcinae TaxID=1123687 RepID=UPI000F7A57C0|nr:hypothetical protein [Lacticaseibacillus porcinae]